MALLFWARACGGGDGGGGVDLQRWGGILLQQRGSILAGRGSILLQWGIGCRGFSMHILVDNAGEYVLHPPQGINTGSSVLTTMAAGGGVLKVGGTAKMSGTWACVMVPTDDLAAIPARRKCAHSWKSCHSYGSLW
jgi:hypothetical protein